MQFDTMPRMLSCRVVVANGLMLLSGLIAVTLAEPIRGAEPTVAGKVSFDRDVRPILSNHCWKCHGPDAKERKAGLRLDQLDSATQPAESGKIAVVPNKPGASELLRRIHASDADEQIDRKSTRLNSSHG